jgi:DNA-binding MarR family transcriptional regulator
MSGSYPPPSTDELVEQLAQRLRRVDLVGWTRVVAWAEESELSLRDLRLLLALAAEEAPSGAGALAEASGLPLDAAYPALHDLHGRGYVREERREYSLSEAGEELVAALDAARREGIRVYVSELDPRERRRLEGAFGLGP